MELLFDLLHEVALTLYKFLVTDDVQALWFEVVFYDALLHLLPVLVGIQLAFSRIVNTIHINYKHLADESQLKARNIRYVENMLDYSFSVFAVFVMIMEENVKE